jgi:eukaryotic-like serine/threonine-protein kinase
VIGSRFGQYRILERLGAGGMGRVYRARDERLERDVAIKVLPTGALADEDARKRFRKEALTLSKLNHASIETIHDFNTDQGVDFLLMELVPGRTLSDRIAEGPIPEKEVARLGEQLAEGLAAAHGEGILHCDIKPGNLRVTPSGRLKILDFGLARLARLPNTPGASTRTLTADHEVAGTLPYMAPEQLRGQRHIRDRHVPPCFGGDATGAGGRAQGAGSGSEFRRSACGARLREIRLRLERRGGIV